MPKGIYPRRPRHPVQHVAPEITAAFFAQFEALSAAKGMVLNRPGHLPTALYRAEGEPYTWRMLSLDRVTHAEALSRLAADPPCCPCGYQLRHAEAEAFECEHCFIHAADDGRQLADRRQHKN